MGADSAELVPSTATFKLTQIEDNSTWKPSKLLKLLKDSPKYFKRNYVHI